MGSKTTIQKASSVSNSFRTTVPANIMHQFDLKEGDGLDWALIPKDGELAIIVKIEKKKRGKK